MIKLKTIPLFCSLLFIAFTGCHQATKFNTPQWKVGDGLDFPLRNDMLDDLVKNYHLKGMTYKQVQHLLSYPEGSDSASFYYEIIETYNNMARHEHVKRLVFYMGKDSVITGFKIYDKHFKK